MAAFCQSPTVQKPRTWGASALLWIWEIKLSRNRTRGSMMTTVDCSDLATEMSDSIATSDIVSPPMRSSACADTSTTREIRDVCLDDLISYIGIEWITSDYLKIGLALIFDKRSVIFRLPNSKIIEPPRSRLRKTDFKFSRETLESIGVDSPGPCRVRPRGCLAGRSGLNGPVPDRQRQSSRSPVHRKPSPPGEYIPSQKESFV